MQMGWRRGPILKGCQSSIVPLPGPAGPVFSGLRLMLASLQAGIDRLHPPFPVTEKGSKSREMLSLTQLCPSVLQGH